MSDAIEVTLLSYLSLSVAAEWQLRDEEQALITAVVFTGSLLGSCIVWGPITDLYGRRVAFLAGTSFVTICAILSAVAPNYLFLLFTRFGVGIGVGCAFVPYDLFAEFLPASHRGSYLMNINYFWTLGTLVTNGFAWLLLRQHGWRVFTMVASVPVLLGAILSAIYLPESPRWLIMEGDYEQAREIIYSAAQLNGTRIEPFFLLPLTSSEYQFRERTAPTLIEGEESPKPHRVPDTSSPSEDINDEEIMNLENLSLWNHYAKLVGPDYLHITIPLWLVYITYSFAYFGTVLYLSRLFSARSDSGYAVEFDYKVLFTNSASEIAGVFCASCVIDIFGRKASQIVFYVIAATSVLSLSLTSGYFRFIMSLISRLSIMGASGLTWAATPELYPTSLRALGHSLATSFSRIGAILAPFLVANLLVSSTKVGMILCFVNLISVVSVSFLPETFGHNMESRFR